MSGYRPKKRPESNDPKRPPKGPASVSPAAPKEIIVRVIHEYPKEDK